MDDKARTEATRWLILLQEQPDDRALDAAFHAWLAAGPGNAAAWAETRALGDLIAQSPLRHRDQWMQKPRRRPRAMIAAAAALAIAAAIVIALTPNLLLRVTADHATGTAQSRAVTLPDGPGEFTFRLLDAISYKPEPHTDHKVRVTGYMVRLGAEIRVNVQSLQTVAPSCAN